MNPLLNPPPEAVKLPLKVTLLLLASLWVDMFTIEGDVFTIEQ